MLMTKTRLNNVYIATTDFGIEFENGESGLIRKGERLRVTEAIKGRSRLEKIGWISNRSLAWHYLKLEQYEQMVMELK